MKVVDALDARMAGKRHADLLDAHPDGRSLEQHPPRGAQQAVGGAQHQGRDEQRRDRVGAPETGREDHATCDRRGGKSETDR